MKLPINMLLHEVEEGVTLFFEAGNELYNRPLFYQDGRVCGGCILYEGDGKKIIKALKKTDVLICSAWSGNSENKNIVLLKKGYTVSWASNVLHRLFDKWDCWEVRIQEQLYRKASLHDLLEISFPCFNAPITVMNRDFKLIALVGGEQYFRKNEMPETREGDKLPLDQVNQFKLDPDYLDVEKLREPFLWPASSSLPFPVLCMNIYYNDIYCARVVMFSNGHVDSWYWYLLDKLVGYLESAYVQVANLPDEIAETVQIMEKLLLEDGVNTQEISKLLAIKNWEYQNRYQAAVIQVSAQDIANGTIEYIRQELLKKFPFCLSVQKEHQLVLLANLSQIEMDEKEFRQEFSLFVRDENFRVGFSNEFTGLEHFYVYYQQAEIALRYGVLKNPMIWQHYFDDYAMDYFLDKGFEQLSSVYLKPKELLILEAYDKKNKTELYQTLKVYLKNGESAVRTAKEMFVQRGTILYRISRIEQLTGIKWEDYKRKVFLSIAFLMEESL